MKCPKCPSSELVAAKPKGTEITLDYCKQCQGLFLEKGELEPFIKNEKHRARFKAKGMERMLRTTHSCPKCVDAPLFAGHLPGFSDEVDHCPKCNGHWMDKGELAGLIAQSAGITAEVRATAPAAAEKKSSWSTPVDGGDGRAPYYFKDVADSDEVFLWTGAPNFFLYVLSGLPVLFFAGFFGLVSGILRLPGGTVRVNGRMVTGDEAETIKTVTGWIFALPVWLALFGIAYLIFSHRNTRYAVTSKRLIIRSGVFGIDYKSIDFDQINNLAVNVGIFENMMSRGTIMCFSAGEQMLDYDKYGRARPAIPQNRFIAIENPYEVYRLIKELSVNVKTDWYYPNALRPGENPGYGTKLKRGA